MTDRRLAILRAALGFLELPPRAPELRLLHRWLDSWMGVGLITVGVERLGYRLSLSHIAGRRVAGPVLGASHVGGGGLRGGRDTLAGGTDCGWVSGEASRMSVDDDRLAKEDLRARERLRFQWMLESVTKFRLFFVGLVFAMLAFAVQFSLPGTNHVVRLSQFVAWVLLLITGCLAIRDAGGFVPQPTEPTFDGLSTTLRRIMWACFVLAIGLLIAARLASQLTTTKGA